MCNSTLYLNNHRKKLLSPLFVLCLVTIAILKCNIWLYIWLLFVFCVSESLTSSSSSCGLAHFQEHVKIVCPFRRNSKRFHFFCHSHDSVKFRLFCKFHGTKQWKLRVKCFVLYERRRQWESRTAAANYQQRVFGVLACCLCVVCHHCSSKSVR